MKKLINIKGKEIYVEIHGDDEQPKLLYLHGGPGSGCYDFTYFQSNILSKKIQLIAMDQRGVGRSEELSEEELLSLNDIVEDCEELRKNLGIKKWSLVGHSFGGMIAVLYAKNYPDSIEKIIFECPTFDLDLSSRSLLKGAIIEYEKRNDNEMVEKCLSCIGGEQTSKETWFLFTELTNALEEDRQKLYFKNADPSIFETVYAEYEVNGEEMWRKLGKFQQKIYQDAATFENYLPMLKELKHPTLLIKGKYDWVTSKEQVEYLLHHLDDARCMVFENSGHFPHFEEKERFAQALITFLT